MALVDYGQVPAEEQHRKGYWTRHPYKSHPESYGESENRKWINNKYLNSWRKNNPGQALVGQSKVTGKWSILVVYEKVGL